MMTPWFIAAEKFGKTDASWEKCVARSGLEQLDEVVSLDSSPSVGDLPLRVTRAD